MSIPAHDLIDLDALDREIDRLARLLRLCREGNFRELTAIIERDVCDVIPGVECAMCLSDTRERRALAERRNRLLRLLE